MKPINNKIPEPEFPEHRLIRESAVLPELSVGLRQRVLTDCVHQFRIGRRRRLVRSTTGVIAVFCALFGMVRYLTLPDHELTKPVENPPVEVEISEPADLPHYPSVTVPEPKSLANGQRQLDPSEKKSSEPRRQKTVNELILQESDQIRILIDTLQQRDRKLGAIFNSFSF
ncbi:MAG: hypothetical protein ACK526_08485 [Planctomyces sp.]|jgi:hypothetical protein